MTPNKEDILTLAEVAARFRVDRRTVMRSWVASGHLPCWQFGRRVLFKRSDVDRLWEEHYGTWKREKRRAIRRTGAPDHLARFRQDPVADR